MHGTYTNAYQPEGVRCGTVLHVAQACSQSEGSSTNAGTMHICNLYFKAEQVCALQERAATWLFSPEVHRAKGALSILCELTKVL